MPLDESTTLRMVLEVQATALEAQAATLRALAEQLATPTVDMLDQRHSPLGKRRHCAAVRRRIDDGQFGANIVGRKHLLSPDALAEEMAALNPAPTRVQSNTTAPSIAEQLAAECAALS